MLETPEHLAERLRTEGEKTVGFFRALTLDQLKQTLYTEGAQWTVRQLLAHFVSTEAGITELIENILTGGSGAPQDFSIDRYNERRVAKLNDASFDELLQSFISLRQVCAELVGRMKPDDLLKTGRHPFLGMVPLEEIIKMLYLHNQIHQRDVRKLLA
jgi:hypothetical protein